MKKQTVKENTIGIKISSESFCVKCKKSLNTNEEIIILKNSSIIHKKCFEELKSLYE